MDITDPSTWPIMLKPEQVAEILQVSVNHVYNQCDLFRETGSGLPNRKLGTRVLISRKGILDFANCEGVLRCNVTQK